MHYSAISMKSLIISNLHKKMSNILKQADFYSVMMNKFWINLSLDKNTIYFVTYLFYYVLKFLIVPIMNP